MDGHLIILQKAVDTLDGLNPLGKFEADAKEDRHRALLEVDTGAVHDRFGYEGHGFAIPPCQKHPLALLQILRPIERRVRNAVFGKAVIDRSLLIVAIAPDNELRQPGDSVKRFALDKLLHRFDARAERVFLFPRGMCDANSGASNQPALAVRFFSRLRVIARDLVPKHFHLRQHITFVRKSKVRRLLQEDGPRGYPKPEFPLLMRMQREMIGLGGIALEEAGLRLRYVHHVEERGIGKQLHEVVGRGRSRGDEFIFNLAILKNAHELAESLNSAKSAQDRRFVERATVELARVQLPLADRFIIREIDSVLGIDFPGRADKFDFESQLGGVDIELLPASERRDNEKGTRRVPYNQPRDF